MAPNEATFTKFLNFPPEIRDMIWDEALRNYVVVWPRRWSFRLPSNPLRRLAFNPAQVALSCRAAADRWRRLYPLQMLYHPATNATLPGSARFREESTIFVTRDHDDIFHIIARAEFVPRHFAVILKEGEYHAFQFEKVAKIQIPNGTLGSITKIREFSNELLLSPGCFVEDLEQIVRRDGPGREMKFNARGLEWMQCVRPHENLDGGFKFTVGKDPRAVDGESENA